MRTAVMLLVVFMVVRTAFLTQVETPEPRYVLECFPALLALGALVWLPRPVRATRQLLLCARRFRVNRDARDLRKTFLDAIFQRGRDVVDLGDGQVAIHRAMAGDQDFVLHQPHVHFVAVRQLVKFRVQAVDELLDVSRQVAHFARGAIRRRDVRAQRLDVNIHARARRTRRLPERRQPANLFLERAWRGDAPRASSAARPLPGASR